MLIHQLPAEPAYLRVKTLRRLKAAGAVALKNSVYVLPDREPAREDFHWIRREIVDGGGEATLTAMRFLEGTTDSELIMAFQADRNQEYAELMEAIRDVEEGEPGDAEVERLRRRLNAITERDFFASPGRRSAERAFRGLSGRVRGEQAGSQDKPDTKPVGATWVTRRNVYVDRMASAWVILRFIDPRAKLRYVAETYRPRPGEIRFDMYDGEYTHEGDGCTFETLVRRFALNDPALAAVGEIVHDIDCKDDRYGRAEAAGIASVIRGLAATHVRDEDRVAAASHVFEALWARFREPIG